MPIAFTPSKPLTLGVELELQLVDWRRDYDRCPGAPKVFERLGGEHPHIKHEIFQSMVEIDTGICATVAEVTRDLGAAHATLRAACDDLGLCLAGGGTHPFARFQERLLFPSERYRELLARNRWLARRLSIFGLHVHLGMRDGDHAIAMMNAIGPYLGHLLALSSSSPFWNGHETGLASSRVTVFEAVPTAGTPPTFERWSEFETLFDVLVRSRAVTSVKDLWWDMRPSPGYGTLEIRICDAPATLSEVSAIVALLFCLATELDADHRDGRRFAPVPSWLLRENKWRAARHGVDADLVVDTTGDTALARDDLARMVDRLLPTARRLGCEGELRRVDGMLAGGCSYERQRRLFAETLSLPSVAQALVDELRRDEALR